MVEHFREKVPDHICQLEHGMNQGSSQYQKMPMLGVNSGTLRMKPYVAPMKLQSPQISAERTMRRARAERKTKRIEAVCGIFSSRDSNLLVR